LIESSGQRFKLEAKHNRFGKETNIGINGRLCIHQNLNIFGGLHVKFFNAK